MSKAKKRILILAANPKNTTQLRLSEEVRDIKDSLERSQKQDEFEIVSKWAVQPRDLQRAMLRIKPHFVHFSGHGSGQKGLIFEDHNGYAQPIDSRSLAELFDLFSGTLECVILNGCYSEFQAKEITTYIENVIGMQWAINDKAAIEFAVGFYDALWAGETIEFAYRLGCSAIYLAGFRKETKPILFTKSLITTDSNTQTISEKIDSASAQSFENETIGDSYRRAGHIFGVGGYRIAYVPAYSGPWHMHYREFMPEKLKIIASSIKFTLKPPYRDWPISRKSATNLLKCRLESITALNNGLELEFSPTYYEDYLRSGEQVELHQKNSKKSYHEWFLEKLMPASGYISPFRELTNICGIGLFILTRDHRLIAATRSDESHVYPGRLTFCASGTMPWSAAPDPYTAVILKAREEIHHMVEVSKLRLFASGVDSRKLYFQFSFIERSNATAAEITEFFELGEQETTNRPKKLNIFSFQNAEVVCEAIVGNCWEPAAEAAMLALAAYEFGEAEVEAALRRREGIWWRRDLVDEWDHRASRPGLWPDMSVRYNKDMLQVLSSNYLKFVKHFISKSVRGGSVIEIGAGTGRISQLILSLKPSSLTCIELCQGMIIRNRARLKDKAERVVYLQGFAQDILQKISNEGQTFDTAVCSLVLVHNTKDQEAIALIRALALVTNNLFLFEDIRQRPTSPATKIRSEISLRKLVSPYFDLTCAPQKHDLDGDIVLALHLVAKR